MGGVVLVFDMDGTITAPVQVMSDEFADLFSSVVDRHPAYIVSGSDIGKIEAQVPQAIRARLAGIFCCAGNEFWSGGTMKYRSDWRPSDELLEFCLGLIEGSLYPERAGCHIEVRTGMMNVSVVGRNATAAQREAYAGYDMRVDERLKMVTAIMAEFPDVTATVGGQISIDVHQAGRDKGQVAAILGHLHREDGIHFFGNRMDGNDAPLACALKQSARNRVIEVTGPCDTFERLVGYLS